MAAEPLPPSEAQPTGTLCGKAAELCRLICGEGASAPDLHPRSGWTAARGLLGEYFAGTEYRRAERGREASIVIHQTVLAQPDLLRTALAHELLHHWEEYLDQPAEGPSHAYPAEVEALIHQLLQDALRQRRWRGRHSQSYVAKAQSVCALLDLSLKALLFPSAQRG